MFDFVLSCFVTFLSDKNIYIWRLGKPNFYFLFLSSRTTMAIVITPAILEIPRIWQGMFLGGVVEVSVSSVVVFSGCSIVGNSGCSPVEVSCCLFM